MRNRKPIRYYLTTYALVSVLVILQILFFVVLAYSLSWKYYWIDLTLRLISVITVIAVINRPVGSAYKLSWCVPILLFPVCGGVAYLVAQGRILHNRTKTTEQKVKNAIAAQLPAVPEDDSVTKAPALYLRGKGFSAYRDTAVRYFGSGEEMYASMLDSLKAAKKFIFMEFFIVCLGEMWDSIHEILLEKVKEGVEVRILYDGMGSVKTLPRHYDRKLREEGIRAEVFRPYVPLISTVQNNRDHRKIVVIDGEIGYTGGINLSDEYINRIERFGKWKDSGILIKGNAVISLTRFFLELWDTETKTETDLARFLSVPQAMPGSAAVIPYCDSPLDDANISKNVYLDIIHGAKRYLYITTPYLIPGNDILDAICHAAQSGVSVAIITPHIADKPLIHAITRSYYSMLIESGVKICEYLPGFVHSKMMIADDEITAVGTVNLDYRSLYLHFECGSVILDRAITEDIKNDFLSTLPLCREIGFADSRTRSPFMRIILGLLRVFEPLL